MGEFQLKLSEKSIFTKILNLLFTSSSVQSFQCSLSSCGRSFPLQKQISKNMLMKTIGFARLEELLVLLEVLYSSLFLSDTLDSCCCAVSSLCSSTAKHHKFSWTTD